MDLSKVANPYAHQPVALLSNGVRLPMVGRIYGKPLYKIATGPGGHPMVATLAELRKLFINVKIVRQED